MRAGVPGISLAMPTGPLTSTGKAKATADLQWKHDWLLLGPILSDLNILRPQGYLLHSNKSLLFCWHLNLKQS